MTTPNQDQLKALEQTRQRLIQLSHSLGSLIDSLNQSNPLPSWSSLQSQANIISNNLQTTSHLLSEQQPLLTSLVLYPSPTYPTKTQSNILEQLLRTKLDPRVEDWVARGRGVGVSTMAAAPAPAPAAGTVPTSGPGLDGVPGVNEGSAATTTATAGGSQQPKLTESELDELWTWAPVEANREARRRNWGGNYTLEEVEGGLENVATGLRRVLEVDYVVEGEEGEEEEEEGEEEGGEGGVGVGSMQALPHRGIGVAGIGASDTAPGKEVNQMPGLGLDEALRFMTTGMVSGGRGR